MKSVLIYGGLALVVYLWYEGHKGNAAIAISNSQSTPVPVKQVAMSVSPAPTTVINTPVASGAAKVVSITNQPARTSIINRAVLQRLPSAYA